MNATLNGIDIHAHGVPKQFLEEVRRTRLAGVDVAAADNGGYIVTFPGPRLTDALDATGIDAAGRRMIVRDTAESLFRTTQRARA